MTFFLGGLHILNESIYKMLGVYQISCFYSKVHNSFEILPFPLPLIGTICHQKVRICKIHQVSDDIVQVLMRFKAQLSTQLAHFQTKDGATRTLAHWYQYEEDP